jgi:hypothetical protein
LNAPVIKRPPSTEPAEEKSTAPPITNKQALIKLAVSHAKDEESVKAVLSAGAVGRCTNSGADNLAQESSTRTTASPS